MHVQKPLLLLAGVLVAGTLGACGEDDPPPPPPRAGGPGAKRPPPGKGPKTLVARTKIEDRVTDENEKRSIRHIFKDRDFAVDVNNRDPFQSFILVPVGLNDNKGDQIQRDPTKKCTRPEQYRVTNYSYTDLRLVGVVAEKAQRRVLMMDPGNLGHLIKKGDCVGREKALVKDIGAGYITFTVEADDPNSPQARPAEEHSVQLYPNQVGVTSQPRLPDEATKPQAPVVAPPGAQPGPAGGAPVIAPPVEEPPR